MSNQNIQIGIDLGTTNSEVAINVTGEIEIVKNALGDEYTPSVFGVDKSKNKVVGKRSYERLYKEASQKELNNNKAEVKRLMGTEETIHFERIEEEMNAEEISAEILKSLKEDILRKHPDFDTTAAVITVPAYFSGLQCEATKRAGNMAGFKHVVLIQEPIAAAISYGFMNEKNENWLIFDLGGGTFDVALISINDGILSVLSHDGDNFLGGKDFDWLIVEKIILPKLLKKYSLEDFHRGNRKYGNVFAKLKYIAENAKMYLSQYEKTTLEIDGIGGDDEGEEIYVSIDFSRKEFEKLITPLVNRAIDLSKKTIKDSGVNSSNIGKIILVGGPTLVPYIRKRLEKDLCVQVDSSVDPLTVVSRGACIFAISQKIPSKLIKARQKKQDKKVKEIILHHETLTADTEESISGVIDGIKDSNEEYYIQIQSDSGFYSGTKTKLKNGKFFDTVMLESNKANLFWIYLFNEEGESIPISNDSFVITHGLSVSGAPIPHSVGVVLAKKDFKNGFSTVEIFEKIFEKGDLLPLEKTETYKTIRRLDKSENDNPLWIRIGEGESEIPDRNVFLCELGIKGDDLPYDLPGGTEIEITIEINESRELFVTAYIPLIDLTLNARSTFKDEILNIEFLETELNAQAEKLKTVASNCTEKEKEEMSNSINSLRNSIQNASLDEDEKRKANKQLKDLKIKIDNLEKSKEMPQLIKEFHKNVENTEHSMQEFADNKDVVTYNEELTNIKTEGERALESEDKELLIRINEQLQDLIAKILFSNPSFWVYHFEKITNGNYKFINEKEAEYYKDKGGKAIELNDGDELKRCVHNLMLLLPPEDQEKVNQNLSGITR